MITFKHKGDFSRTTNFLERTKELVHRGELDKYGRMGVDALRDATPIESGETADSWRYEIVQNKGQAKIVWCNDHVVNGCNIAVILQYGHATRNGGWVEGTDYINPAIQPIFDMIADTAWKEVTRR